MKKLVFIGCGVSMCVMNSFSMDDVSMDPWKDPVENNSVVLSNVGVGQNCSQKRKIFEPVDQDMDVSDVEVEAESVYPVAKKQKAGWFSSLKGWWKGASSEKESEEGQSTSLSVRMEYEENAEKPLLGSVTNESFMLSRMEFFQGRFSDQVQHARIQKENNELIHENKDLKQKLLDNERAMKNLNDVANKLAPYFSSQEIEDINKAPTLEGRFLLGLIAAGNNLAKLNEENNESKEKIRQLEAMQRDGNDQMGELRKRLDYMEKKEDQRNKNAEETRKLVQKNSGAIANFQYQQDTNSGSFSMGNFTYSGDVDPDMTSANGKGTFCNKAGSFVLYGFFVQNCLDLRQEITCKATFGELCKFKINEDLKREFSIPLSELQRIKSSSNVKGGVVAKFDNDEGIIFCSGYVYKGQMKDNVPNGLGIKLCASGEVLKGLFNNGSLVPSN